MMFSKSMLCGAAILCVVATASVRALTDEELDVLNNKLKDLSTDQIRALLDGERVRRADSDQPTVATSNGNVGVFVGAGATIVHAGVCSSPACNVHHHLPRQPSASACALQSMHHPCRFARSAQQLGLNIVCVWSTACASFAAPQANLFRSTARPRAAPCRAPAQAWKSATASACQKTHCSPPRLTLRCVCVRRVDTRTCARRCARAWRFSPAGSPKACIPVAPTRKGRVGAGVRSCVRGGSGGSKHELPARRANIQRRLTAAHDRCARACRNCAMILRLRSRASRTPPPSSRRRTQA